MIPGTYTMITYHVRTTSVHRTHAAERPQTIAPACYVGCLHRTAVPAVPVYHAHQAPGPNVGVLLYRVQDTYEVYTVYKKQATK